MSITKFFPVVAGALEAVKALVNGTEMVVRFFAENLQQLGRHGTTGLQLLNHFIENGRIFGWGSHIFSLDLAGNRTCWVENQQTETHAAIASLSSLMRRRG